MLLNYQHTNREQLRAIIKVLLGENISAYWPDDEINITINEALLSFGGLSGFWKENIQIATIQNQRLYDIFVDFLPETKPTLTFGDILNWFNRDLIEEISDATPTSDLFILTDLLKLIAVKYNAFQLETNLVISQLEQDVAAENNIVIINDTVIDIVRVVYAYNDGVNDLEIVVRKADEQELSYYNAEDLTEEDIPQYYSTLYGSPNEIKLYPIPTISGKLKLIYIGGANENSALETTTVINLPNNLVPYLKYGIEQHIFSKDGLLNDPARADYCKKRWEEGIAIGKIYSSILTTKANGVAIDTDSLNNLDNYIDHNSLSQADNPPSMLGLAGFNIFEIDTLPSDVVNSILLMIQQNAIIPAADESMIQIDQSYIEVLAKYCVHLLQMKSGIADISSTATYLNDFQRIALNHNKRLQMKGFTFENLIGRTKREEVEKPRLVEDAA